MFLNLSDIANHPDLLTYKISLPPNFEATLRPLKPTDTESLAKFLKKLSKQTRQYYTLDSYDLSAAKEYCEAIGRYDKLRLVLEESSTKRIIAIFELSFDIPASDRERYSRYNIELNPKTDCRFGPCIDDDYQNLGIGTTAFPHVLDIARLFGKKRIILWGGVFANNERAISFYTKNGFERLGSSYNKDGKEYVDMIIFLECYKGK